MPGIHIVIWRGTNVCRQTIKKECLTFNILRAYFAEGKLITFFVTFHPKSFDIPCKLSPKRNTQGPNLHKISKPIFWRQNYSKMLSSEIFQRLKQ